jgi:hypothetical protein
LRIPLIKVAGVKKHVLQSAAVALLLCLLAGRAGAESSIGSQQQEAPNANLNGKKIAFAVEDQYQANASHSATTGATGRSAEVRQMAQEESEERARAERASKVGRRLAVLALLLLAVSLVVAILMHRSSRR